MSVPTPPATPVAPSRDPEEVLKLSCPVCSSGLNLRRKHVGIEGKCVQCKTPVEAREVNGTVALVRTDQPAEETKAPAPAQPEKAAPTSAAPAPATPPAEATSKPKAPEKAKTEEPETPAFSSVAHAMEAAPMPAPSGPSEPAGSPAPSEAKAPAGSTWGFPDRNEDTVTAEPAAEAPATTESESSSPTEAPEEEPPSEALSSFMASIPAGKLPAMETETAPEAKESPEQPSASTPPPFPSSEASGSNLFDSPLVPDPNLQPASAPSSETPTEEPDATTPEQSSPANGEKSAPAFTNSASPFNDDEPLGNASSALFGSAPAPKPKAAAAEEEAPTAPGDEEAAEMIASWGTRVPTQNHASISPFAGNPPENSGGFAETLFREKAGNQSAPPAATAKSPYTEAEGDSVGATGALFASAGQSPTAAKPKEEVVLDGDGRPMKPMTDDEKDSFAKEMMQVGEFHRKSPWVVRLTRLAIILAVIGGVGYGAYVFMPEEKVKEWKNKTLDWLEPGTVLLDFLPFEIRDVEGGEEGEKEIKIKAIDGLNNLTGEMDSYLDTAENNLKEGGASVPEREKNEQMEAPNMPKMPKLPFELPSGSPKEEAESAPEE